MKKAILLAAYGSGSPLGRAGLRGFEERCRQAFPGVALRWAFTSPLLRDRLAKARQKSDSVSKALQRLRFEKFQAVAIQPLQTICGGEYGEVCAVAARFAAETGVECSVGLPLLKDAADSAVLASSLAASFPDERGIFEDIVFMGHGARHPAGGLYASLDASLHALDRHAHVGAMNGNLTLAGILPRLTSRRVWLLPLLSVIGTHATRDMAGGEPTSWKSLIEGAGHECIPVLRGMVEFEQVAGIWLDNLKTAAASVF